MFLAIDHGNKQIKTIHHTFSSGLYESSTKPPFGKNVLFYQDKYYTLSDQRIPYMRDKTADERFFVLTLFAIAFEFRDMLLSEHPVKLQLGIGLPPAHYGTLYQKFEAYFLNRGVIDFQIDGRAYSILITSATCFPQAYAAVVPVYQQVQQSPKTVVIDIGGFTADYLQLKYGEVDLSVCDSLENGVILLYNRIRSRVNAEYDLLLDESDIDAVLKGAAQPAGLVQQIVLAEAQSFVDDLLGKLRERMIDLRSGYTVFAGGGAALLRRQLASSERIGQAAFVEEISANVKGYELLYRASMIGG